MRKRQRKKRIPYGKYMKDGKYVKDGKLDMDEIQIIERGKV